MASVRRTFSTPDGAVTLYLADCRHVLPQITADVLVTDPPWDMAMGIPGSDNPRQLFAEMVRALRPPRCAAVQLGCHCDPCFLAPLAARMKYLHTCWLRYARPSYRGRVMVEADVAYVYGEAPPSAPGRRVLSSTSISVGRQDSERAFLRRYGRNRSKRALVERTAELPHPMARHLTHVEWLVRWHSEPGQTVLDPFLGSGTTAVAALRHGRKCVGVEVKDEFFELACARVQAEVERYGLLSSAGQPEAARMVGR